MSPTSTESAGLLVKLRISRIFLRIYGGMVLASCLVGALAMGGVNLVNALRAEVYREQMVRGTFYVMAQGIQRQQEADDLGRWLDVLARIVGTPVELKTSAELELSGNEDEQLSLGKVIIRINDDEGYGDVIYRMPGQDNYIYTRMTKVSEQHARATALLILDDLSRYPRSEWEQQFERIRVHFGYPLGMVDEDTLKLDREQQQRLSRREVVMAIEDRDRTGSSGIMVYAAMGSSGKVLVMGPMFLFERYPVRMMVIIGVLGLMGMGLAAYFLVRPLQVRLHRLNLAVEQVGRGNLAAKAEVGKPDAVGQLAATFNGMTEHIRRLIESQREMTRAVSHELRTPVARLRFGLEMLHDVESAEERSRRLDALDVDIDQLDSLIDEILTYARLEEGAPVIEFEPIQVDRLMARIVDELRDLSGDITLEIDQLSCDALDPEQLCSWGSERFLHRILQNLVTNALRYARSRVVLRYTVVEELAVLEVEDDGPGIPVQERERVFKPFSRLDDSRHRVGRVGGYGLGLSIVQRVAEWHGGGVEVTSGKLGGALFRVTWPRQRSQSGHVLAEQ